MNTNVAASAPPKSEDGTRTEPGTDSNNNSGTTSTPYSGTAPTADPTAPSGPAGAAEAAAAVPAPVPEPRASADPDADAERGKSKRPRKAVRGRGSGGTKALVVWHQGRVHYADDSVLVIDLDEAASADLDVHDLVDRLAELREALDTPGRAETVTALMEIIQDKVLN